MNAFFRLAPLLVLAALATARAQNPATAPDVPWQIHETEAAIFPRTLMNQGVRRGDARVRLSVGADGQLLDALVTSCSQRAFGEEALSTVRRWRYEAGRANGQPVGVIGDITFIFQVNGPVAFVIHSPPPTEEPFHPTEPAACQAQGMNRLDRIPAPTHVTAPVYPQDWSDRGITGTVTVEFYIDETGHARLPLATQASHPQLAATAVAAVAQWQFEPPTRHGEPVLVHAEQVFAFYPSKK